MSQDIPESLLQIVSVVSCSVKPKQSVAAGPFVRGTITAKNTSELITETYVVSVFV